MLTKRASLRAPSPGPVPSSRSPRPWAGRPKKGNKVRTYSRQPPRRPAGLDPAAGFLEPLSDSNDDHHRAWDRDQDKQLVEKPLAVVQPDFNATTSEAFHRVGVDAVPAGRVAEELGLAENAVILARSRVLKRLREEAGDLLC